MKSKRGYIISYADWFKGFFIGLIIGGIIVYLFTSGVVKMPTSLIPQKEAAKLFVPFVPFLMKRRF
ncbi:hypothetical protein HYY72_05595 [Candidatus Woesearchaeota archaeon]|nr:hypothetical protein [Candidatus Woesearchaeota archaeon]